MKRIFLEELKMYFADHPLGEKVENLPVRADKKFTEEVEPGDIRLFADVFPPRSGLFYKKHSSEMWIVIPLSDRSFTVPASNEEALVEDKVYQFWNEIALPDSIARRSYFETHLSDEEMSAIGAVLCHLRAGYPIPKNLPIAFGEPLTRPDDPRWEYFKAFRLKPSDFPVAQQTDEKPHSSKSSKTKRLSHVHPVGRTGRRPDARRIIIPWRIIRSLPQRLAAAGGENESPSFMLCCKEAPKKKREFSEEYMECNLAIPFCSLMPDCDPGVLTFKYDGALPSDWVVDGKAQVTIHERKTRKKIGSGRIDVAKHEIVIDDFSDLKSLAVPIKSAADLVIVIMAKGAQK